MKTELIGYVGIASWDGILSALLRSSEHLHMLYAFDIPIGYSYIRLEMN